MGLLTEAGIFAYIAVVLFMASLAIVVKRPQHGASLSAALAALGLVGAGLGQRLVDRYVDTIPDLAEKVQVLSIGTREASANLIIGGGCALALVAFSAVMKLRSTTA